MPEDPCCLREYPYPKGVMHNICNVGGQSLNKIITIMEVPHLLHILPSPFYLGQLMPTFTLKTTSD